MEYIRKLPDADELKAELSLTDKQIKDRACFIEEIKSILSGSDQNRKILCIGPCSADNEAAVLDYMTRLSKLRDNIRSKFLIVPRVYTGKPRTSGLGYKGLLHRPDPERKTDNIYMGILATRKLHLRVIQETGFYCADEMLYPEAMYYISDLLGYVSVGARSVEDQQHRLVASGMDMPVGMKNPTGGDIEVMLNAIVAAQNPQELLYHGCECRSEGNAFAHAVLRGYTASEGRVYPNYHYESICDVFDAYQKKNLKNPSVMIDCNHANSRKRYDEQVRIGKEVMRLCKDYPVINGFVKGLMIESYIVDGCQMIGEGVYGKSVTDACLGWEKTEKMIYDLCEII